ncbi:integrator complex subunit 12-like [Palaemon carinicauda]|uniref:integrator complex subunit 12-like n=1 Tax=Palaemon carinicauda TaxID=392227 RepID=UPI0035B6433E
MSGTSKKGDTLTLICHINQTHPSFVFWYHNSVMVNFDSGRKSLKVTTEEKEVTTSSRLTITDARQGDSGNYTCVPPNVNPASVLVFVTEAGDTVAAVQRRGHNGSGSSSSSSSGSSSSSSASGSSSISSSGSGSSSTTNKNSGSSDVSTTSNSVSWWKLDKVVSFLSVCFNIVFSIR